MPGPWEGPMFSTSPNDGLFSRFALPRINRFFDRAMDGPAATLCYLEVRDVEAEDGEEVVLVETASGIDEGRRRGY